MTIIAAPNPPRPGITEAIEAAGHSVSQGPPGVWDVSDAAVVQAIIDAYPGSEAETAYLRQQERLTVPLEVTMMQCKLALNSVGKLPAAQAVVDSMGTVAQIAWTSAYKVHRDSQLLNAVATVLGLSSAEVDDLFRQADALAL